MARNCCHHRRSRSSFAALDEGSGSDPAVKTSMDQCAAALELQHHVQIFEDCYFQTLASQSSRRACLCYLAWSVSSCPWLPGHIAAAPDCLFSHSIATAFAVLTLPLLSLIWHLRHHVWAALCLVWGVSGIMMSEEQNGETIGRRGMHQCNL
jgi:hypothetical protein